MGICGQRTVTNLDNQMKDGIYHFANKQERPQRKDEGKPHLASIQFEIFIQRVREINQGNTTTLKCDM